MKIALVGTHSSGKTTLAKALSAGLPLPIASLTIESVWRKLNDIWPGINPVPQNVSRFLEGLSHSQQYDFSVAAFRAQVAAEHGLPSFIADNSLVQQLGLMLYYASFGNREVHMDHLYSCCYSKALAYTHVFMLPVPSSVEKDGVRPESKYVIQAIDYILKGVVLDLQKRSSSTCVRTIPKGLDTAARVEFILAAM